MDTQNDGLEKVTPFKHGNFWYLCLIGVAKKIGNTPPTRSKRKAKGLLFIRVDICRSPWSTCCLLSHKSMGFSNFSWSGKNRWDDHLQKKNIYQLYIHDTYFVHMYNIIHIHCITYTSVLVEIPAGYNCIIPYMENNQVFCLWAHFSLVRLKQKLVWSILNIPSIHFGGSRTWSMKTLLQFMAKFYMPCHNFNVIKDVLCPETWLKNPPLWLASSQRKLGSLQGHTHKNRPIHNVRGLKNPNEPSLHSVHQLFFTQRFLLLFCQAALSVWAVSPPFLSSSGHLWRAPWYMLQWIRSGWATAIHSRSQIGIHCWRCGIYEFSFRGPGYGRINILTTIFHNYTQMIRL